MAKRKTSPFHVGRPKKKAASSSGVQFLSIKPDESVSFAALVGLDELISADMHEYWDIRPAIYHPCIGRGCPGCQVGNEPRFKGYLPVLTKEGEVAIYPHTVSVNNLLEDLEDEIMEDDPEASLKGFVLKVSRKGSGLATRYTVTGLGKRLKVDGKEVPDFIKALGPADEESIWELLEENGFSRDDSAPAAKEEAEDTADDDEWGDV